MGLLFKRIGCTNGKREPLKRSNNVKFKKIEKAEASNKFVRWLPFKTDEIIQEIHKTVQGKKSSNW